MPPAGTLSATEVSASQGIANAIKNDKIKRALESIAQLRYYLLTEHPSLLPQTAPSLIHAETQIFSIWNSLENR